MRKIVLFLAATGVLVGAISGWIALGQAPPRKENERPLPSSALTGSRDVFGPEGSLQRRLSRRELEQATEADHEEEEAQPAKREPRPRPESAVPPMPAHRFSRDSTLQPFAVPHHGSQEARDWQITLKNSFIEQYKNRATLDTSFRILFHKFHSIKEDGDAHVAGLTSDVGLACVAEIMNVKDREDAQKRVQDLQSSSTIAPVAGVWRLWCEHPDQHPDTAGPQIQDDVIPPYPDSNPNHVFEIHPITRLGDLDLRNTFHTIPKGYKTKEAKKSFQYYDSLTCKIVPDPANQTTTIITPKAEYNYAEFVLRVEEEQQFLTLDGRIVGCSVLDLSGEEVAHHRRMIFVAGTEPEESVRKLKKGDQMHVLGIPRIDLALISYRTRVSDAHPEVLTWNLPYEMIVVGVYK